MSHALSAFLTGSLTELAENFASAYREAALLKAQLSLDTELLDKERTKLVQAAQQAEIQRQVRRLLLCSVVVVSHV